MDNSRSDTPMNLLTDTTILIVEDSHSDRYTYIRYLQSDGENTYKIVEAETLEEGMALWQLHHPEIVLLDINLPDGNGLEFLEYINQSHAAKKSSVIVLTGGGDEQTAVRAMKLGAADYLTKSNVTGVALCVCVKRVRDSNILNLKLARSQQHEIELYENLQIRTSQLEIRELELQTLSERLTLALKSAAIGCWEWDLVENTVLWDDRMYELYAITEKIDPFHVFDMWSNALHPDDRKAAKTLLNKVILEHKYYDTEFRIFHADGSMRFIRAHGIVLRDADNNPQKMIGINLDITNRKHIEEQLLRTNEELIRATRLKDEFLANMSHELRTPLTAVLGMSEILQKELLGSVNERQQKALGAIRQGGQHLLELINDILDVSKILAGKMELRLNSVSVQNICNSSLMYVKQQAFQKHIEIYSNVAENISQINVDERRIRQVLINLLVNAVKFTPKGGKVSLLVSVGCGQTWHGKATIPAQFKTQDSPTIVFQVTDTGIGIDPADLPRLFQPFVQLDSRRNRQYEGTGLGLAMVKQMTELHGGQVAVESVRGQGSSFSVALPYQVAQATAISSQLATPFPFPKEAAISKNAIAPLILLVEDNEASIETFTTYLNANNYRVILAKNGEEGIEMAKAHQPDLILMDMQMPVIDGLQATRLIRSDQHLSTVPIIALTARAMEGEQELCINAGANHYLSKPIELEELIEVIEHFLD